MFMSEDQQIRKGTGIYDVNGNEMLSYGYIEQLRAEDAVQKKKNFICAQRGGQENILSENADISIVGGSRGGPLPYGTRVVTPFGYRNIEDMKVGESIIGRDGGHQKVISKVYHGMLKCYKLKFIDGSEVIASYDHPWNVRQTCHMSKKRIANNLDLGGDWRVCTTQKIVDFIEKRKSGGVKHGHIVIPICEPVKFTPSSQNRKVRIDPYVFGALIGDGCFSEHLMKNGKVNLTTADMEIVEQFTLAGFDMTRYSTKVSGIANDYHIYSDELCSIIEKYGMRGHLASDKFIPDSYKFGSEKTRMSFMQGLMDTDGTIDNRGHLLFTTISKTLAEDVKYMISSLGGIATISFIKTGYTKNGEYVQCNGAYCVYIKIRDSYRLFRLSRKRARSKKFNGGIGEYTRRVVDYEYVGELRCCCIGVSNPDSLFLVEDFVVTHNSKSFSILLEALKDINTPHFSAIILRDSKPDLENIINDSRNVFKDYGTYISSDKSMYWDLFAGGRIAFSYHSGSFDDFKVRFQGKQYSYIAIDEIVQCDFQKFCYLMTTLRNAYGIRNRIIGSCNPGPGWVCDLLSTYWIGPDGYPIPERDGKIRYVYMTGAKTIADFVWGDSRDEVYEKVKDEIAKMWTPDMQMYGDPKDMFIMSIAFVSAKLTDNKKLLESDPAYIARLSNQSAQAVAEDLMGNWFYKGYDNDYVTDNDMKQFFANPAQWDDNVLRAAQDIAFMGGDMSYTWLLRGKHIVDVDIAQLDAKNLIEHTRNLLHEWGVNEENFAYDASGIGQAYKGFFRRSVPFNNLESPWGANERDRDTAKKDYDTLKSQVAYALADAIKYGEVSISQNVLDRRVSGKGYENVPLRDILMQERIVFTIDEAKLDKGKGKCLRQKSEIKKQLKRSPDAMEGLIYAWVFFVKVSRPQSFRPNGTASFVSHQGPRISNRTISAARKRTRFI